MGAGRARSTRSTESTMVAAGGGHAAFWHGFVSVPSPLRLRNALFESALV